MELNKEDEELWGIVELRKKGIVSTMELNNRDWKIRNCILL